ncbi:MAG: tetratricopeptide repeat protein [Candidatus Margulisbacteria bacterium]|nr:tetratricopeptide repeat protein [Candidatus Margulisiibacteriota bacterium]
MGEDILKFNPQFFCPQPGNNIFMRSEDKTTDCQVDASRYFTVKERSLGPLMKFANFNPDYPEIPDKVRYELYIVYWLILREMGYNINGKKPFTEIENNLINQYFIYNTESGLAPRSDKRQYPDPYFRLNFWLAKTAQILANDADNPASRGILRSKLTGSGRSIFRIETPAHDEPLTNDEKVQLFKAIYDNLIVGLTRNNAMIPEGVWKSGRFSDFPTDPLLEAENILFQYFYWSGNPSVAPSLPFSGANSLESKINQVLRDTADNGSLQLLRELGLSVDGIKKSRMFKGIIPFYLSARSNPENYIFDIPLNDLGRGGSVARQKLETIRYLAQALKMRAQLLVMQTPYNHPHYAKRIAAAVRLLEKSQELVSRYLDLDKERVVQNEGDKIYSDLINLIATEQVKATAIYQLALYYRSVDMGQAEKYFKMAKLTLANIENYLNTLEKAYRERPSHDYVSSFDGYIAKARFWRSYILGDTEILGAEIALATNRDLDKAEKTLLELLKTPELLTPQSKKKTQLLLTEVYLRQDQSTKALLTLAGVLNTDFNPTASGAMAEALRIISTGGPLDPAIPMAGTLRLQQIKTLISAAYASDNRALFSRVLALSDELIIAARPEGADPTPVAEAGQRRPNNGLLEDYELSIAIQTRAEAYLGLDNFDTARADFEASASVFRTPEPNSVPLNNFANLGRADIYNWTAIYKEAIEAYELVLKQPNLTASARRRAELGLAETYLRQKRLDPTVGANTVEELANAVLTAANNILAAKNSESYLLQRATESKIEALGALKLKGREELLRMAKEMITAKTAGKPWTYLKIVDELLFIREFGLAKQFLTEFTQKWPNLAERDALTQAKYHVALAELDIFQREYNSGTLDNLLAAATKFFSSGRQNDTFLARRIISDLILYYNDDGDYKASLALIAVVLNSGATAEDIHVLCSGQPLSAENTPSDSDKEKYTRLLAAAQGTINKTDIHALFKRMGLEKNLWVTFTNELILEQAKILLYQKNFEAALAAFEAIEKKIETIGDGSKVELYYFLGEIYRYGLKEYAKAREYYLKAEELAQTLTGDDDFKYFALARIYSGLAMIRRKVKTVTIRETEYTRGNQLLDLATQYAAQIETEWQIDEAQKKISEARRSLQTDSPVELSYSYFSDSDGVVESRFKLRAGFPFEFPGIGNSEVTIMPYLLTTIDQRADARLQNYFGGVKVSPTEWLGFDINHRFASQFLQGKRIPLRYLRFPDISFGTRLQGPDDIPAIKGAVLQGDLEMFSSHKREMDTYHVGGSYPFLYQFFENDWTNGFALTGDLSRYSFPYSRFFQERLRANGGIRYQFIPPMADWINVNVEASLVRESGRDYYDAGNGRTGYKRVLGQGWAGGGGLVFSIPPFPYIKLRIFGRYETMSGNNVNGAQVHDTRTLKILGTDLLFDWR